MVFGKKKKRGEHELSQNRLFTLAISYIGAKTVYFGVGGGILPFCNFLKKSVDEQGHKLKYEKVFESTRPIKGEILKVTWDL